MPGIELKSPAVMRVIRNHRRKNERRERLLFYTNDTVNLSGNIKYRRPNLKGNYAARLIRNQGDGQVCILYLWVDFNSVGFGLDSVGYYQREGLIVEGVSGPISWITDWVYTVESLMKRRQKLTGLRAKYPSVTNMIQV